MNVLFVSDHYVTPAEPGVLRTWQLARYLGEQGDRVHVVAPRAYYPFAAAFAPPGPAGPASGDPPAGVRVSWMRTLPTRGGLGARVATYAAQIAEATVAVLHDREADVVVAGLTPSMLAVGPLLVAKARRVPFVVDERDLSLEAAEALDMIPRPLLRAARAVERTVHRHADAIVAVTPGIRSMLIGRGMPADRVHLVTNGFEGLPEPQRDREDLRRRLGWDPGYVILLYAGNLGVNHDLDVVLDALGLLQDAPIRLAVLGEGELKERYRARAGREGLPVEFLSTLPKSGVAAVCRAADVGLLPLRDHPYYRCSLPNKLFEYLGAELAVVMVGPEGDSSAVLAASGGGIRVAGGDATALAAELLALARDPDRRAAMGRAGRDHVRAEWSRERFVPEFRRALHGVVSSASSRELDRVRRIYRGYDAAERVARRRDPASPGARRILEERWRVLREVLPVASRPVRVLDVGCGTGGSLDRLRWWLGPGTELFGVDILPDRLRTAAAAHGGQHLALAGGHRLPFADGMFDLVLMETVLSSVRDPAMRAAIGREALRVTKPTGSVVCYDMRYPNPANPNVRPVGRRRLDSVFRGGRVTSRPLTLLPPLARSLPASAPRAYGWLSSIPALRSHYLSVISPNGHGGARPSILFVTPADCRFPNMAVNQRLRALVDRGDVEVVSCFPDSFPADVARRAVIRGFPVSRRLRSSMPKLAAFSVEVALWSGWQRLRGRRFDLVYTFQDTSSVAGLALRRRGSGWAMDVLDDPAQELANAATRGQAGKVRALAIRDRALRALAPRPDVTFTIGSRGSDPLPDVLRRHYGVRGSNIVPLHQAVDVAAIRERFDTTWPRDKVVALFVGFVSPLRGVDVLIEAAGQVRAEGLPMEVHLAGHLKDPDGAWLDRLSRAHPGLITYHGTLPSDRALSLMAGCTVGVLPFPPRREMLPVQAVTGTEYLALGKPLIATDLPGARSMVRDGANGWLIPPGDPGAMAGALRRLATRPELAALLGTCSAEMAGAFDVRDVNDRLGRSLARWL